MQRWAATASHSAVRRHCLLWDFFWFHPPVGTFYLWIWKKQNPCCVRLLDTVSSSCHPVCELLVPILININLLALMDCIKRFPLFRLKSLKDRLFSMKTSCYTTVKKTSVVWLAAFQTDRDTPSVPTTAAQGDSSAPDEAEANTVKPGVGCCQTVNKWTKGWVHLILQTQSSTPKTLW